MPEVNEADVKWIQDERRKLRVRVKAIEPKLDFLCQWIGAPPVTGTKEDPSQGFLCSTPENDTVIVIDTIVWTCDKVEEHMNNILSSHAQMDIAEHEVNKSLLWIETAKTMA
ncbi:hypothetical protein H2198_006254 [Neophaeococcomyces mojaviensis]|uniref:Uncharacterized protein n=1 Tax=Neophaeococcomyces mojaviensis TaxID=3383035 RepID=A0ACC3A3B6_9EURO|nr:hypothetical protein H2198_006254 [Knufia sp. JES_112]